MRLADSAVEALVFDENEAVSKVAAAMVADQMHEAVLLKGGKYAGMVFAKGICRHDIGSPEKTKVKNFASRLPLFPPDSDPAKVAGLMVANDYKSVALFENGKYKVATKLSLLGALKRRPEFGDATAESIMHPLTSVSEREPISKCLAVLREAELSRLAVLDKQGRLAGIISSMSLLKSYMGREREKFGEKLGKTISIGSIEISPLVDRNIMSFSPESSVSEIIENMLKSKNSTAVVKRGDAVAGIITPKLILSLLAEKKEGVYVSISGMQQEDGIVKAAADKEIYRAVRKIGAQMPITYMTLYINRHHEAGKAGKRVKYSVKARLVGRHAYSSEGFGWDLQSAIRTCLERLERISLKKR